MAGFWEQKRVLVAGGCGFVGSHLVERLLGLGASVIVADLHPDSMQRFLSHVADDVEYLAGDLRERAFADRAVASAEAVFNMAAVVGGVHYNSTHPGSLFTENVTIGLTLLEAARRAGVERYCVVSSACVYPRFPKVPTAEDQGFLDDPEVTNIGYGWAKRVLELQGRFYAEQYGMKIAVARPYNIYGPRDDFDWETSHVIPALIRKVVEGQDPIEVWGDGSQTRSFFYVTDAVEALLGLLEKHLSPEPVNLGTDEEVSIADLIRRIVRIAGSPAELRFNTDRPRGQPRRKGDFTLARQRIGRQPAVGLDEGLRRTIEWYRRERAKQP
ncbi:MAG: NAD-dependent epimerase/dehydratase family protein [Phycisphaerae bacterium]